MFGDGITFEDMVWNAKIGRRNMKWTLGIYVMVT
jgi:hypothetical protein